MQKLLETTTPPDLGNSLKFISKRITKWLEASFPIICSKSQGKKNLKLKVFYNFILTDLEYKNTSVEPMAFICGQC
jgi:hypothetical protein